MKRLPATFYLLTSVAILLSSWTSFIPDAALLRNWNHTQALAGFAIMYFAAPALFLLASVSCFWTREESNLAPWITSVAVLVIVAPLIHRSHGWKLFAEAGGPLVSLVVIFYSLTRRSSAIVAAAAIIYALVQGDEMISELERYWSFGGSYLHLAEKITPPILVAASLLMAIVSRFTIRQQSLDGQA